jgi:hypothetical protein
MGSVSRPALDRGKAGQSAQAEYGRRKRNDEERVRARHPVLARPLLAMFGERTQTKAFAIGAIGEEIVGRRLDALGDRRVIAIHDRRPRGRSGQIDHIAVGPSGVFVIDSKMYRDQLIRTASSFTRTPKLLVGGRNRRDLVAGSLRQLATVRDVLEGLVGTRDVPVVPMLVFVGARWPILYRLGLRLDVGEVLVRSPRQMAKLVSRPGPLGRAEVERIARRMSDRLGAA